MKVSTHIQNNANPNGTHPSCTSCTSMFSNPPLAKPNATVYHKFKEYRTYVPRQPNPNQPKLKEQK